MPELPEITVLAHQMKTQLVGKTITSIQVLQPKCLNLPEESFVGALTGARMLDVSHHGKWLFVETSHGWLLLNLGMGGEILLTTRDKLPDKYRLSTLMTIPASSSTSGGSVTHIMSKICMITL
jgi:formamidopyrimidine-DNA glycosylase